MTSSFLSRYDKASWKRFLLKILVFSVIATGGFLWFVDNYRVGRDAQVITSIEGHRWYLSDLNDTKLVRGGAYTICSKDLMPIYPECTQMVKFLVGLPGDTVKVSADGVFINGELFTEGFKAGERLGLDINEFYGEKELAENEYWVLGDSPESFDSRYWGAIGKERIQNRAYPFL